MQKEERSVDTKASPQAVWRIWSDTSTWARWNPDVVSVHLDGPFATGTTGMMTTKAATRKMQLGEVEPGRSFRLDFNPIPLTRFSFHCSIAPAGSGSRISQGLSMQGPLAGLFFPMMARRIADTFPALLKGLAAAAERA